MKRTWNLGFRDLNLNSGCTEFVFNMLIGLRHAYLKNIIFELSHNVHTVKCIKHKCTDM